MSPPRPPPEARTRSRWPALLSACFAREANFDGVPACVVCGCFAGFTCRECAVPLCDPECAALHVKDSRSERVHSRRKHNPRHAERMRRKWRDADYRVPTVANMRAAWRRRGGLHDEERRMRGARMRSRWSDPAWRERQVAAIRRGVLAHHGRADALVA